MSKITNQQLACFGKRLATMRKAAGYTQQQLADEIGVTRRMIAYYETESDHPPANLLIELSKALDTSSDALLGIEKTKGVKVGQRLQRQLLQIEQLGPKPRKQIMQLLDTFLEMEQAKQQVKTTER